MFDTQAVARSLTDADLTPAQADAITNAVRQAVEQGDHVTSGQFKAGLAEVQSHGEASRAMGPLESMALADARRVLAAAVHRVRDSW